MVEYDNRRWVRLLLHIHGSVVPRLAFRMILCGAIGGVAAFLHFERGLKLPATAHTILGVALGLLLVFRTNASYDRWWEGRKLLGGMVNRARNLVRQASSYIEGADPSSVAARREIARLTVLLYGVIRQYLRKERDLSAVGVQLSDEERAALEPVVARPALVAAWISRRLGESVRAGRLTEERLRLLDENLTAFMDLWGGCERILKTPIAFAYAQHIKGFLSLFCLTAPFALVDSMRWFTPIAAAVVAYGLFGIEEIGVEIEDPFGYDPNDLPLDAIGARIAEDTTALADDRADITARAA